MSARATGRAICAECFASGLIIETSGAHDEVVKVLAPLTIPEEQFAEGLDILEAATRTGRRRREDRRGVSA